MRLKNNLKMKPAQTKAWSTQGRNTKAALKGGLYERRSIKRGQSAVEYLVLFAIIALLTLLSITTVLPRLRNTLGEDENGNIITGGFLDRAFKAME